MGKFYDFLSGSNRIKRYDAVLCVTGDRQLPLMSALLDLAVEQPEMLQGLIEVIPADDEQLHIFELRQFRPPYMRALGDISQFLRDNGYEAASKFLNFGLEL